MNNEEMMTMDEAEYDVFYACAQKIMDDLVSGKIGIGIDESNLEEIVLRYLSDDPRLAAYDKRITAKKIIKELLD